MVKETGGSAFPNDGQWANGIPEGGMTLRDYFAAKAIPSFLIPESAKFIEKHGTEYVAKACYEIADAMLAERAK